MPDFREFSYITRTGSNWKVWVDDNPAHRSLKLRRRSPEVEAVPSKEEELTLKDPSYASLYGELSGTMRPIHLQEMKLSEPEWAWLKGVLHSLMCEDPNQVPISATLVATSTAL
jgi:hypothetical protein